MSLVLIDTSVWIDILRNGEQDKLLPQVQILMEQGNAAWCGMIRLELWSGVRDSKERKQLASLDSVVHLLEITSGVWAEACHLAGLARSKGLTAPASDQLIFACSKFHAAKILHRDKHFDALTRL